MKELFVDWLNGSLPSSIRRLPRVFCLRHAGCATLAFAVLLGSSATTRAAGPGVLQDLDGTRRCDSNAHRALDFLLGTWNVQARDGKSAGTVEVTPLLAGCAVQEIWKSPSGRTGRSLNAYSSETGKWHQSYVDTDGTLLQLSGGLVDGAMVLLDGRARNRFAWRSLEDGTVHQTIERAENGEPDRWTMSFDAVWKRQPQSASALSEALRPFDGLLGEWDVTPIQQDADGVWRERATTGARAEAILEGRFIEERAVVDLPVGRVEYVLLLGYDPFQEVYRLSWNDSLAGLADIYEGQIDEDSNVLRVDNLESRTFWKTPDGVRWAFRLEYDLTGHGGERRARVFASEDDGESWSLFQTTVYRRPNR